MTELLTAAQMRAIEQAAIDSGDVTGLELMERAGRGVVDAIFEEWPELAKTSHRAMVLCGPGNNGGDGFVVARLLKEWGWEVEVFLYGDPAKLPPDARVNWERWSRHAETNDLSALPENTSATILIDALFGTGLTRPFDDELYRFIDGPVDSVVSDYRVAVDIPSGLCSDSGRYLETDQARAIHALRCDLVVTFHRAKLGHFCGFGPSEVCDKVVSVDIGLVGAPRSAVELSTFVEPEGENLAKRSGEHKYTHGHALILSGAATRTGAARLAARGALRIGAGLVTVAAPAPALAEHAAHLTAIMLREANDTAELSNLLEDDRLNALCLGPGMGTGEATRKMVKAALTARRATVLDADALTAFREAPETLFGMLHDGCVLTPHGGEFARLFPDISEMLAAPATEGPAYSKIDASRDAARRAGCTVLFKGPDTVIADQFGNCRLSASAYDRAAPWLATAGSGDVLAGFITGLLARGFAPLEAASNAAWLHTECALSFGPGLIAEDLPEELPKVFRSLNL